MLQLVMLVIIIDYNFAFEFSIGLLTYHWFIFCKGGLELKYITYHKPCLCYLIGKTLLGKVANSEPVIRIYHYRFVN